MKKAPILSISHRTYICKSISHAAELIKALSSLVPCSSQHNSEYSQRWYEEDDEITLDIDLKASEEIRLKPKHLALKAPKRGTRRCSCGHSDVAPGQVCDSCGLAYEYSC